MEHIQQYMTAYKEQDRKSSLKYIGLIPLMPVIIALLLICAFPFDDPTIAEQYSIKVKQLSVQPDVQREKRGAASAIRRFVGTGKIFIITLCDVWTICKGIRQ